MTITVRVKDQSLRAPANLPDIISGSQEFVKFQFILDNDWDGLTAFAQFRQNEEAYNQYLDSDNCVYLPAEIEQGIVTLMLYATGNNTIATTNYLTLTVNQHHLISDTQSTTISQSLYTQLVTQVSQKADVADVISERNRAMLAEQTNANAILLKADKSELDEIVSQLEEVIGGSASGGDGGVSPTIAVTEIAGGHTVTITDVNGMRSFNVMDGSDGDDGMSPVVTVTPITGGSRVSITDRNGTNTFDVMNGTGGSDGGYVHPETHPISMITGAATLINTKINDHDVNASAHADQFATKVDKVGGKTLSDENYTHSEKTKLAGIDEGANNYQHPNTHPASVITGLADVATSGNFDDLVNRPTGLATQAYVAAQIAAAAEGYAPATHNHTSVQIGSTTYTLRIDTEGADGFITFVLGS